MQREPNTEYILSLSYGKDSIACLEAIKQLGYPLDRIVHAEVWATDTIPADLPPMVKFKEYADKIIEEKYGIKVEHIYAVRRGGEKLTYECQFYEWINKGKNKNRIYGFPYTLGAWCNNRLKVNALSAIGRKTNIRKAILPHTETQGGKEKIREMVGNGMERDAERTHNSNSQHSKNQFSDSQFQEELGATATSNLQPYGFPISIGRGNWCTGLKTKALKQLERKTTCFQKSPIAQRARK